MLALIETGRVKGRRPVFSEIRIFGVKILRITLPEKVSERKRRFYRLCRTAGREAVYLGVSRICCREDFPGGEIFADLGLFETSRRPLYEKTAADILSLASEGKNCAAVFTQKVYAAERKAVMRLAEEFRHILLFAESGDGELSKLTGERYGASIIEGVGGGSPNRADAALFFAEPKKPVCLSSDCAVFGVTGLPPEKVAGGKRVSAVRFSVPEAIRAALPEGYPEEELLSELIALGVPETEKIRPEAVSFDSEGFDS